MGAWGFNESSGTIAADASGARRDGTISGATRSTAGKYGQALSFDGVNDLVTVPDSAGLDLTTGMTVEAWVNPATLGQSWRTVAIKEMSGDLAYGLYAHTSRGVPSAHANPGSDSYTMGPQPVAPGAWTHLAATYDGQVLRLLLNGTQVSSTSVSGLMRTSNRPLRIGGNQVWPEWFQGRIDEVRVYNRALSAGEVAGDMTTAVNPG